MIKFVTKVIFLFLLIFCMSISLLASSKKKQSRKTHSTKTYKIESFAGGNDEQQVGTNTDTPKSSLIPILNSSAMSPGVAVGNTWYDYQHNGSMGRMIDWGPHSGGTGVPTVHFGWMRLAGAELIDRHYAYNHYNAATGVLGTTISVLPYEDYGGFVNLQSASDGSPVMCGHRKTGLFGVSQTHLYWDVLSGFGVNSVITDSVASYNSNPGQSVIWPKFRYQEGTDTVTHVIARASSDNVGDAIYYFRKVGISAGGSWDYPPYIIDTIYTSSHDIAASRISDKVAIVWNANLNYDSNGDQYPLGVCDTCSGDSPYMVNYDNDVYYQISYDQGLTWEPRVNITKYRLGEAGFRAYNDLSALIDSDDNLHVLWTAVPWTADPNYITLDKSCRLFHYSEDVPYIRTVVDAQWSSPNCGPGFLNLNIAKMSLSECNGKLYALWTQFNDVPNGIVDDCAARAYSDYNGSANGELFVSVSSDNGLLWDTPRNLTNSYTPNCDPEIGYDCESDMWASMARFGRQNMAGEDWSGAEIVDPSGSYGGDYYLDVQYVHDRDAGGIVLDEGSWQLSNINWFRMACVEPVISSGQIVITPDVIDLPIWVKPGVGLDLDLTLENIGNADISYTIVTEEDNGPEGWLATSGLFGLVPAGLSNIEVGTLHLNQGGIQVTEAGLVGRVIFTSNSITSPDTIPVYLAVVDTLVTPSIDTVSGYLSLVVSNNGNYGNMGNSGLGRLNLDFVTNGVDCDTTADIYLYDASPIIMTVNGSDTVAYHAFRQDNWLNPNSFRPIGGQTEGLGYGYNWYSTGTFVTPDSTVAIEQTFYVPTASGSNFIIKKLKVWSYDGSAHAGLRIGDVIDWDIPSDSSVWNESGIDVLGKYIYQSGSEFHQDDTGVNAACIDSDRRFGGMKFLKSVLNGTDLYTEAYSAYTASNDLFIEPTGNLVSGELWNNMGYSGFSVETDETDQHTVMCYDSGFTLGIWDTLVIYTALATVYDGVAADLGIAFTAAEDFAIEIEQPCNTACCQNIRGNVNSSYETCYTEPSIDISDLVYFVAFMFQGGTVPSCPEEADVDASGAIDISDLVYLVSYMFQSGPLPASCW